MKYKTSSLNLTANLKSSMPSGVAAAQKRLLLIGDSTTYGKGANPLGVAGVEGSHVNSPARLLASALTASGVQSSSRSIVGMGGNTSANSTELYYNATPDVNVVLNGWSRLGYKSIGGNIFVSATAANVMRFDFNDVDRVAIGLPLRSYGSVEYRIDGGAWVAVSESSGVDPDSLLRLEIDLGAVGAHYVEFRATAVVNIYVIYCEAWNSTDQLVIVPWGARGYDSDDFNATVRPWSYLPALSQVPFDAVVLNIGINDVKAGATTSEVTYTADLIAYIDAVLAANATTDIFLQIPNDIDGGLDYVPSVLATLAGTYGATLLDSRLAPDMTDYATANAAGKMYDTLHPSDTGYAAIWNYFEPTIRGALT